MWDTGLTGEIDLKIMREKTAFIMVFATFRKIGLDTGLFWK